MKVWKQFDTDCSGYIEADELKQFIKTLLAKRQGKAITEEKLIEYTDTIVSVTCLGGSDLDTINSLSTVTSL